MNDLENTIKTNYDTDPETDSVQQDSSIDEIEQLEIERIKSDQAENQRKTNVYTTSSDNEWTVRSLHSLHDEMKQEFLMLSKQASDLELNQLNENNELSQLSHDIFVASAVTMDDDDEELPNSNLYRDGSSQNWKNKLIDKQKAEMTKQLIHLAKLQNENNSNKTE